MHIKLNDFKTGWYSLEMGLSEKDIDELINSLIELKRRKSHLQIVCSDKTPALENLEIYWAEDSEKTNSIFAGFPIEPTK
nr:hypothetical protein [uncultured Desulfobacter sp.]